MKISDITIIVIITALLVAGGAGWWAYTSGNARQNLEDPTTWNTGLAPRSATASEGTPRLAAPSVQPSPSPVTTPRAAQSAPACDSAAASRAKSTYDAATQTENARHQQELTALQDRQAGSGDLAAEYRRHNLAAVTLENQYKAARAAAHCK